jgi:hypothetical protein
VQNALLQNKSIAHLCLLPIFSFALTFLRHFSNCIFIICTIFLLLRADSWTKQNRITGSRLHPWRSLSTEAVVGWRDDVAMASAAMASSADDGGSNGNCHGQLFSGGWCRRHHPVIGIDGGGKDAIAAAAINRRFHWRQLILPPSMAAIVTAT